MNKQDEEFLINLANQMNAQDNRMTGYPIYCVMDKQEIASDQGDIERWHDGDWGEVNPKATIKQLIKDGKLPKKFPVKDEVEIKIALEDAGYTQRFYVEIPRFTGGVFLIQSEAEKFIKSSIYHYTKPYIYVFSGHRSPELTQVLRIISQMGDTPNTNSYNA